MNRLKLLQNYVPEFYNFLRNITCKVTNQIENNIMQCRLYFRILDNFHRSSHINLAVFWLAGREQEAANPFVSRHLDWVLCTVLPLIIPAL